MPPDEQRVQLFMPCLADMFYPVIGRAAIRVLRSAGIRVRVPKDQTCCGQWAVNLGRPSEAKPLARHFLRVFGTGIVVSPSASCVLTVRKHYPEIFQNEPAWRDRALAVAGRTYEITDFLVNRLGAIDLGAWFPHRVTLHDSCHPLRGLGLKDEPRRLLARVEGLELAEMAEPEVCCGFGGAFMAKHPELSRTLAQEKVDQAMGTGADTLVFTEPGCLMNVASVIQAQNLPLKAVHLVQVLAGRKEHTHAAGR
jgi:L-lactate dehydrogenase complex protein LldE